MKPRVARGLLIASPFVLLAAGTGLLVASPWPAIFGLMIQGHQVMVAQNPLTIAKLVVAIACFVAALSISFTIKRR